MGGDEARTLRPLQAAAVTYRLAFGPRAGQKALTRRGAMPRESAAGQPLCADIHGFSLHAAARCGADDREALEQLCRYITRPALADERVQTNAAGQVVLKLKTPWRDGTTQLVMSPLESMQRLAALVPCPRLHLIRFHRVLAPNAKLRSLVVPQEPVPAAQPAPPAECEANCEHHRPARMGWAKLLRRVPDLDLQHCPTCGGVPRAAGDREDPYAPGLAGPGTAPGTSQWAGAASGLSTCQQPSIKPPASE